MEIRLLGLGRRKSVEAPDVHVFVQDSHDIDHISAVANAVIECVRSGSMSAVAGTSPVTRPPDEWVVTTTSNSIAASLRLSCITPSMLLLIPHRSLTFLNDRVRFAESSDTEPTAP
ncbi:hypothetical protein BZL29_7779 [Mycobacterium kansasii]|uniref:Uncharacterized protein n=1 Tax=Mycobacterium kansasii TaxID=1768 RepID=A0A1V3WED9_MYCKA|nr:hypothetical protein BZL29_7779 [Mycobacterium kansasii]